MTKRNPILFALLMMALSSLACLSTVTPAANPTPHAVRPAQDGVSPAAPPNTQEIKPDLVLDIADPVAQETSCAQVTAPEAVHLRTDATEHSPALDWLLSGETVTIPPGNVIEGPAEAGWTLVTAGNLTGYVRAIYLQKTDCPK